MVFIRHYAPNAEGLVYLQKAVLSMLAVSNKRGHMGSVKPQLCRQLNAAVTKNKPFHFPFCGQIF